MNNLGRKSLADLSTSSTDAYLGVLRAAVTTLSDQAVRDKILGFVRARDYARLLEWSESSPSTMYEGASLYYEATQVRSLVRKYPFTSKEVPGIAPEAAAREKFDAAERLCRRYNRIIPLRKSLRIAKDMVFWDRARSFIAHVLGETPDIESIFDKCDFSGGASIGVHGNATNIARKLCAESWSVTASALEYALPALWSNIHIVDAILPGRVKCYDYEVFSDLVRAKADVVSYNKVAFVPKTARTHRSIAVEPLLNGFIQKGIDMEMRSALRRCGIDLSDQSKNQRLARVGSEGGFNPYCTIDLSSASDSMSIAVVRELLPPEWFELLCAVRSTQYLSSTIGDDVSVVREYEKFCSMGNGFCFPLETLIFASVAYACNRETGNDPWDLTVYGDDIVIRQNAALLCIEKLRHVGFRTNVAKTCVVGPFRESCGADWYGGQDVRPAVLDNRLDLLTQVMSLHNSFYRSPQTERFGAPVMEYLRSLTHTRFYRPGREQGDTAFSVPLDVAVSSPQVLWDKGVQQWSWQELRSRPRPDTLSGVDVGDSLPYIKWLAILRGAKPGNLLVLRYTVDYHVKRVTAPPRYKHWSSYPLQDARAVADYHMGILSRRIQVRRQQQYGLLVKYLRSACEG